MFAVGDYIIYGNTGVCQVESIGSIGLAGVPKEKLYYTLVPVYSKGSKVYTPTNNSKVVMRPVITKEEALSFIDDMDQINPLIEMDDIHREQYYREALQSGDCRKLVQVIRTLYDKKQTRIAEGKKVTTGDEKYFSMAEDFLFGELAISLHMEKGMVKDFIVQRIETAES